MRSAALLGLLLPALSCSAQAAEEVALCYNYGCLTEASIRYSDAQLDTARQLLAGVEDAARERMVLALVVGQFYAWAGQQSPIANDRGGDFADEEVAGRMDCIDHATSTTRLLRMFEALGLLRFHRVLEPVRRTRFFVAQHFSAAVEQIAPAQGDAAVPRFVIDSWFYDNGMAAVVLPLDDWLDGAGPDV